MPIAADDLRADCSRCAGLCCVALAFAKSADFGFDKPAGEPCQNLAEVDFRCRIHPRLRASGFAGCTVFECFGAGQRVTQLTFGGRSWRQEPESSRLMFDVFAVMRPLHELLVHLDAAGRLPDLPGLSDVPGPAELTELTELTDEVRTLTGQSPETILAADLAGLQRRGHGLLGQLSRRVRAAAPAADLGKRFRPGADLMGAELAGRDLRGADLRGAYLIAADLRGADLRWADLIGADLRDAELARADLGETLFLTQPQLDSARGDEATVLPPGFRRPAHWSVG